MPIKLEKGRKGESKASKQKKASRNIRKLRDESVSQKVAVARGLKTARAPKKRKK